VPILEAYPAGDAEVRYCTPASEFALSRLEPETGRKVTLAPCGPQILLCTAGTVRLDCGGTGVDLTPGHSVWISAADPDLTVQALTAGAQVFRARLGEHSA
jgi:mannose-6-phosphate isomerase